MSLSVRAARRLAVVALGVGTLGGHLVVSVSPGAVGLQL